MGGTVIRRHGRGGGAKTSTIARYDENEWHEWGALSLAAFYADVSDASSLLRTSERSSMVLSLGGMTYQAKHHAWIVMTDITSLCRGPALRLITCLVEGTDEEDSGREAARTNV